MDLIVNSAIQSPLIRTMETVSTKAGSFTHHIPDNAPPLSMNKVTVVKTSGLPSAGTSSAVTFSVPAIGYLHKVVVRMDYTQSVAEVNTVRFPHAGYLLWDSATLKSRNRPIETLYSAAEFRKALRMPVSESMRLQSLAYPRDVASGAIKEGSVAAESSRTSCDLLFSSCHDPSLAINTRFVEPLELDFVVRANTVIGHMGSSNGSADVDDQDNYLASTTVLTSLAVDFYFINYHDLTEQDIRANNFKPTTPAVMFMRDTVLDSSTVNASALTQSFTVRSNNLAYGISCVFEGLPEIGSGTTTYVCRDLCFQAASMTFTGSGQTLYNIDDWENGMAADNFEYQLSTMNTAPTEGVLSYQFVPDKVLAADDPYTPVAVTATTRYDATAQVRTHTLTAVSRSEYYMNFALSKNPKYNSGCIGLQTISNPQINVTVATATDLTGMRLLVYVHHHALVQIDPSSGSITRSVDH